MWLYCVEGTGKIKEHQTYRTSVFSKYEYIYFLKCIKQHHWYTCLSYRQIVVGQCNLLLNFPIYRRAMYVLWQTKKRCMSCGRPEMHTGRTRNVMHVLWQTRNAYRTYQKCDVCSVADQNCVQDIPEMHTGYTYIRNAMYVLWQTRNAYKTYQKCDACPVADQNLNLSKGVTESPLLENTENEKFVSTQDFDFSP